MRRPNAPRWSASCGCSRVRTDGTDLPARSLSGGNQQKLVIGKWLMMAPRILLLNDPTRGIDVGTKQEMYQLLRQLADAGAAILFYSTDYDELVGCCDPRAGACTTARSRRELIGAEITERALISSALNIGAEARQADARQATDVNGDWVLLVARSTRARCSLSRPLS
jgi:ribose transport system ATP-binding protein